MDQLSSGGPDEIKASSSHKPSDPCRSFLFHAGK